METLLSNLMLVQFDVMESWTFLMWSANIASICLGWQSRSMGIDCMEVVNTDAAAS